MAVFQAMLLFRTDKCIATPHMVKKLGRFHHQVVQQLMGQPPSFYLVGVGTDLLWHKQRGKRLTDN